MPGVKFVRKPSKTVLAILLLLFALTVYIIATLQLSVFYRLMLLLFSCSYLYYVFVKEYQLRQNAVHALQKNTDQQWLLTLTDGRQLVAELRGESIVTAVMLLLYFKCETTGSKYHALLFSDSLDHHLSHLIHEIKWT